MKKKSNLLILPVLLAGLAILSYPTVSNWLATRSHSKAIQEYQTTVDQLALLEIEEQFVRAGKYNASLNDLPLTDVFVPGGPPPEEYTSVLNINGMIGYLDIPTIGVYLPIYHTSSEEVLQKGVGHMEATAFPIGGAGNHPVLTAHRGLPSAKLFTDLNKLSPGDTFYVHVLDQFLAYTVDQIVVAEPSDTGELRPSPDADLLTLVTCTPYAINSHRLFVRGTRSTGSLPEPPVLSSDFESAGWWAVAAAFLFPALLLCIYRARSKER